MRWGPLLAPLVLLGADSIHVQVIPDSTGGYRLSFGGSTGQYEGRELGCNDEVLNSWSVPQRAIGVELEARPGANSRVSIWGARDGPDLEITTWGIQLAGEWRGGGIGGGIARTLSHDYADYVRYADYPSYPGSSWAPVEVLPSIYLRGGSEDRLHVRVELAPPSVFGSAAGRFRFGLATNQGWRPGTRFQAGLSVSTTADAYAPIGFYADSAIPLARHWELRLMGTVKPSADNMDGNIGFALRRSFGAPPARKPTREPPPGKPKVKQPDDKEPGHPIF